MSPDDVGLRVDRSEPREGTVVLHLAGELDLRSAPHLRSGLSDVLGDDVGPGPGELVVDLSELGYADSAGLSLLVAAHRRMAAGGGRLVLRRPSPPLQRLLAVSGLVALFDVDPGPG